MIGVFGVVVGGAQFFSIPLFQLLFPGIGLGALVANFKMGSFFRGIGSAVITWSKINWKLIYSIVGWPILGTLGGAFFVSQASRAWILPSVILAVVVNEFFTHFKKDFPRKIRRWNLAWFPPPPYREVFNHFRFAPCSALQASSGLGRSLLVDKSGLR